MSAETIDFVAQQERTLIVIVLLACAATGLYLASGPIRNPLEFPKMAESVRTKEEGPKSLNFALSKVTPFLKKEVRAQIKKTTVSSPAVAQLPAPLLVNPPVGANVDQDKNVLMTWEAAPLAQGYQVQISYDLNFSQLVIDQRVPEAFFVALDTSNPGEYYWRAKSVSETSQSGWSQVSKFTVVARKRQPASFQPASESGRAAPNSEDTVVGAEPQEEAPPAPSSSWIF